VIGLPKNFKAHSGFVGLFLRLKQEGSLVPETDPDESKDAEVKATDIKVDAETKADIETKTDVEPSAPSEPITAMDSLLSTKSSDGKADKSNDKEEKVDRRTFTEPSGLSNVKGVHHVGTLCKLQYYPLFRQYVVSLDFSFAQNFEELVFNFFFG